MICGNLTPDHATIARFLRRDEQALCDLFGSVLGLCERAGLVGSGVVAIDGTKVSGNANRDRNVDYDQIAREIIAEAIKVDEAEDELYGERRGDELPEQLRTHEGRREWLRRELRRDRDANVETGGGGGEFDADRILDRIQGRQGWTREARRHLEADRWANPVPVARARSERLRDAAGRLEDELAAETRGNRAYEQWRAGGQMRDGRRFSRPPNPWQPPTIPGAHQSD